MRDNNREIMKFLIGNIERQQIKSPALPNSSAFAFILRDLWIQLLLIKEYLSLYTVSTKDDSSSVIIA